MKTLELWGGHECTVNRVGEVYYDQTRRSGHHDRVFDLDLFADLGLTALRYPLLWERVAPDHPQDFDWSWTDERLSRMAALDIRPIAGLVHHGAGPRWTGLAQKSFAPGLAAFARAAAERYPWVRDWTPVNEPLTTARFACLYGLWHPHLADEGVFWTALLNQIDGVRLAMREIRKVNPEARLIQTEDLGRTYSTAAVAHQTDFDNRRRWMTWDLLSGQVTPGHALWARLCGFGLEGRLRAIAEDPCPPDVVGVNHYLTSDRFLDHRCEGYPPERCGGNDFMRYADVEAVRVLLPAPEGLEGVLEEAWARYGRPLAVTEAHAGCTREEQMRWLAEAWDTAKRLRARGHDIEAVTAWSLLGAFDWNSLLTRHVGRYEPGAFDVSGPTPRATGVAQTIKALVGRGAAPAAQSGLGWWRRDIRLTFQPVFRTIHTPEPRRSWTGETSPGRPLLIAGATGTLGKALARACEWRGLSYVMTDRAAMDLGDPRSIAEALERHQPWAVINAAGYVRVDDAEVDHAACFEANAEGAVRLARACGERDLGFVGFSSDLVFDGRRRRPYLENDPVRPLNVYGKSKAKAEQGVLALGGRALMIRTAAFFSPYDRYNFACHVVQSLSRGEVLVA
ncbi:MAG TPA: family 1 glycosylhydrolase, partial [Phenylobacterium sp.]|nr:family 1 glycosylhydrolase [Phenylobacterium sp.]